MSECKVKLEVKKTWWFYALKPIWYLQAAFGSNYFLLIDKAFKFEVVG
jgi:hypothetical protein